MKRYPEPAGPRAALAETEERCHVIGALVGFLGKMLAITDMEVRKLLHDPTELLTRAVQPTLWLLVFGQVMSRARIIETGDLQYIDFLVPGILAQSVLFIAIFNGISIIWERDLGIVNKFLVSPTPRAALVLGKALAGGVRALAQTIFVVALALALGVKMRFNPIDLTAVILLVLLGAAVFSTFSLIIACLVKTRERFMGIGQLITMPLFFASNAIYPTSLMPDWLQIISHVNPLTYQVDGLRVLLLPESGLAHLGIGIDFLILAAALTMLVVISARLYPNIVT